jgi:hypothetical protein
VESLKQACRQNPQLRAMLLEALAAQRASSTAALVKATSHDDMLRAQGAVHSIMQLISELER